MYDNDIDVEVGSNFLIFDGPIGRFRFFVIQLVINIILIGVVLTKDMIIPFLKACPVGMLWFLLIVVLGVLYINFVAVCKRLYDIFASWKHAIICGFVLNFIILPIFPLVGVIAYIVLLFIRGKMLKSLY